MSNNLEIAKKYFEIGSKKLDEELYEEAEQQFISSLNYLPDRVSTLAKLLLCKIQLRKYNDCEKLLAQIEVIDKGYLYGKFAKALYLGEIIEFEKSKKELLSINIENEPIEFKSTYFNCLGTTLYNLNEYENSILNYKKSIELNPNNYLANYNLGTAYLSKNNFKDGWKYYEYRLEKNNLDASKYPKDIEEIEEKQILIKHEQGFGDTIQFSRLIPELKKYNCKIDFLIPKSLNGLFSINGVNIINHIDQSKNYQFEINLMSLPYFLDLDLDQPPQQIPLNPELIIKNTNTNKIINIGVAWSGNENYKFDKNRSINLLSLRKIFELQKTHHINFHCLQKDVRDKDFEYFKEINMKNFGNLGFFDLSKEILNLDLVISSDTSILHLSSSLGIKTYGLLGYRADWRWLDDDKKYSWYNSLEIFKLKKNQNWEDLSNTIVDNIIKLI